MQSTGYHRLEEFRIQGAATRQGEEKTRRTKSHSVSNVVVYAVEKLLEERQLRSVEQLRDYQRHMAAADVEKLYPL